MISQDNTYAKFNNNYLLVFLRVKMQISFSYFLMRKTACSVYAQTPNILQ